MLRLPAFSLVFPEKKEASEGLREAQRSLSLQEEVSHRTEMEKRSLERDVGQLRTNLQAAQAESKALQVRSMR